MIAFLKELPKQSFVRSTAILFSEANVLYEVARRKRKKYCFFVYIEKQMNRQEKCREKKFKYKLVLSLTLYLT